MTKIVKQVEVRLSPQGRLVIPVEIRRNLGLEGGVTLIARVENSKLVLEKPEDIKARLRSRFQNIPPEVSLADELIKERRQAARKEA